jgi:hypothetical protein
MIIEQSNFWHHDIEKVVFNEDFPFTFIPGGTTGADYPGLAHTLVDRVENIDKYKTQQERVVSPYWDSHFGELFYAFTRQNKLEVTRVTRAAVNLTFHQSGEYPYGGIHIDHYFPHYNFIYCINSFDEGATYLFEKRAGNGDPNKLPSPLPIEKVVRHEKNKALCFDGEQYHAGGFPAVNDWRCMFVVTFTAVACTAVN